jgi:hypothetical protein
MQCFVDVTDYELHLKELLSTRFSQKSLEKQGEGQWRKRDFLDISFSFFVLFFKLTNDDGEANSKTKCAVGFPSKFI